MDRKIVRLGQSTLVVSLPLKWARKQNLNPGDSVKVDETADKLLISGEGKLEPRKAHLDAHEAGILSRRMLAAIYKAGYDIVEVEFKDPSEIKDIEAAVDLEAVSFEIVSMGKNSCTIRSISEATEKEFQDLLHRTVFLLQTMSNDLLDAVRGNDTARIKEIKQLEKTNNKLTHFCRRSLNRSGYAQPDKTAVMYTIVEQLENVADMYKFLCLDLEKYSGKKASKEVIDYMAMVDSAINDFCSLFFDYRLDKAKGFAEKRKNIITKGFSLFEKKNSVKDIVVTHHLLGITNSVFDILGPLIALRL
jgi:phosphate uptake regulator